MPEAVVLAQGQIEKIGLATADLKVSFREEQYTDQRHAADHQQALSWMMEVLQGPAGVIKNSQDINAVGHRVVHGGLKFYETTLIDAHVLAEIHALSPLAPLHNPAKASRWPQNYSRTLLR
jgi:acetate kinase